MTGFRKIAVSGYVPVINSLLNVHQFVPNQGRLIERDVDFRLRAHYGRVRLTNLGCVQFYDLRFHRHTMAGEVYFYQFSQAPLQAHFDWVG